jgi:hypothetical protein
MGYESASMVEFIVDTLSGDFDFMEMNTQLQLTLSSCLIIFFLKILPSCYCAIWLLV